VAAADERCDGVQFTAALLKEAAATSSVEPLSTAWYRALAGGVRKRLRATGPVDVSVVRDRLTALRRSAHSAASRGRPWAWQAAWNALPAVVRARDSRAARIARAIGGGGGAAARDLKTAEARALAVAGRRALAGAEHAEARKDLLLILYGRGERFPAARALLRDSWPADAASFVQPPKWHCYGRSHLACLLQPYLLPTAVLMSSKMCSGCAS